MISECIDKIEIKTPLIWACLSCEKDNLSLVKYLIEHGADINIVYESIDSHTYYEYYTECKETYRTIKTPLYIACERENELLIKYLVEQQCVDINAECVTYFYNWDDVDDWRSGEHDEIYGLNTMSPLGVACGIGNESIVKYLVEHGADINTTYFSLNSDYHCKIIDKPNYVYTPLCIACNIVHETIVKYLVEYGANILGNQQFIDLSYQQNNYWSKLSVIGRDVNEKEREHFFKRIIEDGKDIDEWCEDHIQYRYEIPNIESIEKRTPLDSIYYEELSCMVPLNMAYRMYNNPTTSVIKSLILKQNVDK